MASGVGSQHVCEWQQCSRSRFTVGWLKDDRLAGTVGKLAAEDAAEVKAFHLNISREDTPWPTDLVRHPGETTTLLPKRLRDNSVASRILGDNFQKRRAVLQDFKWAQGDANFGVAFPLRNGA